MDSVGMSIPLTYDSFESLTTDIEQIRDTVEYNLEEETDFKLTLTDKIKKWLNVNKFDELNRKSREKQEKVTEMFYKMNKTKYFTKIGDIWKRIANNNFLMNLLKAIFFLALFDPKGKFLTSILNFVLNMARRFLTVLAERLPSIIRTMWDLLTNVIPDLLRKLVNGVIPAIGGALKAIGANFKGTFFGDVLNWIGGLFGKDGILLKGLNFLIDNMLIILGILAGIKATVMLIAFYKKMVLYWGKLKKAFQASFIIAQKAWMLMKLVFLKAQLLAQKIFMVITSPMFLTALIIIGVIIGVIKLIKWIRKNWKRISQFFTDLWEGVKNVFRRIGGFFNDYLIAPIKKAFNWVVDNAVMPVVNWISNLGSSIWQGIRSVINSVIKFFRDIWNRVKFWESDSNQTEKIYKQSREDLTKFIVAESQDSKVIQDFIKDKSNKERNEIMRMMVDLSLQDTRKRVEEAVKQKQGESAEDYETRLQRAFESEADKIIYKNSQDREEYFKRVKELLEKEKKPAPKQRPNISKSQTAKNAGRG